VIEKRKECGIEFRKESRTDPCYARLTMLQTKRLIKMKCRFDL
jgi:hypothetical protein